MQWHEGKDLMLMHEVLGKSLLVHKPGSQECGHGWQNVADNLNSHDEFRVTVGGTRDRIINLIKKCRIKNNKPDSKIEVLLEEIINISEHTLQKKETKNEKGKEEGS